MMQFYSNKQPLVIICKLIISSIVSILILSIFIYFYHYSLGKANPNKATDEIWYPNQFNSNMEEGFAWLKMDKNGFNNSYIVKKDKIDVLLIGSSHLEALQIKSNENICYLLNKLCSELYFYNIGMSGHFLPTNINNLANTYNYYRPEKAIIIETDKIKMNLPDIVSVLNGNLKRKTPNDKGINHYIKNYTPILKCLGQKIVKQIDLWKKQSYKIFDKNKISAKEDNITDLKEYESTMNKFVSLARKSIPDNVFLIIFYHPNYIMQIDGKIKNDTDKSYLDIFAKVCKNNKIIFIDTDKELQNLYYTKKILPCGFINTAVGYGHLNKYGHEAIANRLAEEIKKLENNYGSK